MYLAVKTIEEAKARLIELDVNSIGYSEASCECGITTSCVGYDIGYRMQAEIAVCDCCGSDDAFNEDVMIKF